VSARTAVRDVGRHVHANAGAPDLTRHGAGHIHRVDHIESVARNIVRIAADVIARSAVQTSVVTRGAVGERTAEKHHRAGERRSAEGSDHCPHSFTSFAHAAGLEHSHGHFQPRE
jgi:hypothetical protein